MAQKRMFSLSVVDTDKFLEMPQSTQNLYFHLGMRADDDGFIGNVKKIIRMIGANDDDLRVLITKQFVIPFQSGVIVIRHWRLNNYLQKDRLKPTIYQQELKQLTVDESNVYNLDTKCIHRLDKYSVDKYSIDKNSIDKNRLDEDNSNNQKDDTQKNETKTNNKKSEKKFYGENKKVFFTDEQYEKLKQTFPYDYEDRIQRLDDYMASKGKPYKDCLATLRNWARKEGYKFPEIPKENQRKFTWDEKDLKDPNDYNRLLRKEVTIQELIEQGRLIPHYL